MTIDGLMVAMYNAQISIHTPARGVTIHQDELYMPEVNFNPHSRTGSDEQVDDIINSLDDISIHTPARGVTIF